MAFAGKNPFKVPRRLDHVGAFDTSTLTGNVTLTKYSGQVQRMDPGGSSRNITLPTVDLSDEGYWFHFDNAADANESLVIKNAAGTTIITVLQNGWGDVYVSSAGAWTSGGSHVDSVGFASGITVDTISEATPAAGVTADGFLMKDGGATATVAATAAAQGINSDLTVNHATGEGVAFDATAVQLTTARSSGNMSGVKATTTSLAGDSGGVYSAFYAAAPTDGGGSAVHNAILVGAGHDALIDVSAAATGEADIVVGDNLALALQVRQSTNAYLDVVTTNDAERLNAQKIVCFPAVTTIDMADAAHALVLGTAGAGETKLLGNIVFCDANSSGTEDLTLPTTASCDGMMLFIANTGGESIVVKNTAAGTVVTIPTTKNAWLACDGTTWYSVLSA